MDDICVNRVNDVTEGDDGTIYIYNYCVEWGRPGDWWPHDGWNPDDALPEPPGHAGPDGHGMPTKRHCQALKAELDVRRRALEDARRVLDSSRGDLESTIAWSDSVRADLDGARVARDAAEASAFEAAAAYFEKNPEKRVDLVELRRGLLGLEVEYLKPGGAAASDAVKKYTEATGAYRLLEQAWQREAGPRQRAALETLARLTEAVASESAIIELLLADQRNAGCR